MKTLYNTIQEGLLADIDTTIARGEHDVIISRIFSNNIQQRREAFNDLQSLVESYRPKRHMTTAKMKSSDSYFVQFTKSYEIKDGDATATLMPYFSYIHICKQTGPYGYRTTFINASDELYGHNINDYIERWQYTRSNFSPQGKANILYEVPEELNSLFERIQTEAYNHRS